MKIKVNNNKYKNKLLELQILKSKIYKNVLEKKIENNKIKLYLKKVATIIHEYHIKNKTILFLNFPYKFINHNIMTSTKHIFISHSLNNSLQREGIRSSLNNKQRFFDLIVEFNPINNNLLNESYNSDIPTILITNEVFITKLTVLKQSYKILGYIKFIEEQINNNFVFSILNCILKQPISKKIQKPKRLIRKKKIKKYKYIKKRWR